MSNSNVLHNQNVQWRQVWSLVALDLAIVISWIAYHKYQPELLKQFRFDQFKFQLALVQGLILFATPPIAGWFADRARRKGSGHLPVVTVGINFVSMIFMVVAVTIWTNPSGLVRLMFPLMIVLWLVFMNIFHSPAISTLEMFVPTEKLPQVMAIFAVITDVAASLEPSIIDLISIFGAPVTFAVGGVLVFGSGIWLQRTLRSFEPIGEDASVQEGSETAIKKSRFDVVIIVGLFLGLATMFFFELFPQMTEQKLSFLSADGFKGSYFTSALIAFSAVLSYPLSLWAQRFSVVKAAWAGGIGFVITLLMILTTSGNIALIGFVLYPVFFAIMSVTFLPIAFVSLSSRQKVLGVGLFFSGIQLASSVVEAMQAGGFL
ncbi:hypothetical protein BKI52_39640 [marine bacterium AO1-C]|nr:hypothetical protein BKI52_39640 [marine bacterium AO1-C]